jgi:hypothetical protein
MSVFVEAAKSTIRASLCGQSRIDVTGLGKVLAISAIIALPRVTIKTFNHNSIVLNITHPNLDCSQL